MRPRVVATIQRLPQRTIDSIRPTPGTVSPCAARQAPLGPSSTTVPPATSRIVQPSTVVGRVSGIAGLGKTLARSCVAAAADAMLLVVDGSLLAAVLARRGLRERSCRKPRRASATGTRHDEGISRIVRPGCHNRPHHRTAPVTARRFA